jgi:hypothetical protein
MDYDSPASIPSLVGQCLKFGDFLNEKIRTNNQNPQLAEKFSSKWVEVKGLVHDVKNLGEYPRSDMTPEICKLLERLQTTVSTAIPRASSSDGHRTHARRRFTATWRRDDLDETYSKLSNWQKDMLQRLAMVNASRPGTFHNVPALRQTQVPQPRQTFQAYGQPYTSSVPMGEVLLPQRPPMDLQKLRYSGVYRSQSQPRILVEFRPFDRNIIGDSYREEESRYNVYSLVTMLKSANPQLMSILSCAGVFIAPAPDNRYELQLNMPDDCDDPRSLRDLLTDSQDTWPSINSRFRLAKHLASSIVYMHSGNFVHKMIKPENILLMTPVNAAPHERFPLGLGLPFLVGFDRCRPASMHSGRYGEGEMQDCLYQHSSRWGIQAEEAFSMSHDIYSLGVVLLEVGLWKPLVEGSDGDYRFAHFLLDFVQRASGGDGRHPRIDHRLGRDLQARLISIAQAYLPRNMGEIYTQVVLSCLNVMEDGIVPSNDTDRPDVEKVGIGYIKFVLSELESLHI